MYVNMATENLAYQADSWLVNMVNGDTDLSMSALIGEKANAFDTSINADGVLTQKAWMTWIANHSKRGNITHIITNIDGALKIQGRTNRPNVQGDNPNSRRIDTLETILDPLWPSELPIHLVTDSNWTANYILGISKPNAIIMFESSSASYNSVEQFVTRRSTTFRADFGAVALRFYDRAFHLLKLIN